MDIKKIKSETQELLGPLMREDRQLKYYKKIGVNEFGRFRVCLRCKISMILII